MKKHYICYVAGRSGGHIVPALTLANQYKKNNPDAHVIFISTNTAIDKSLTDQEHIIDRNIHISLNNVPGKKFHRYPHFFYQLCTSMLKSFYYLVQFRPTKIIAMGGYISIPVIVVAWILHIPTELFELNVVPGKATLFLKKIVSRILICFSEAKQYLPTDKCFSSSYPVRFSETSKLISRKEALAFMTFLSARKTILILGGSQGSQFINNLIKKLINNNPEYHNQIQVIHQTGLLNDKFDLEDFYIEKKIPAFVFDYCNELEYCYRAADLIICRAGAGTLFEINFFEKPFITIPLQTVSTAHQVYNAQAMAQKIPTLCTIYNQNEIENNQTILFNSILSQLQKEK